MTSRGVVSFEMGVARVMRACDITGSCFEMGVAHVVRAYDITGRELLRVRWGRGHMRRELEL